MMAGSSFTDTAHPRGQADNAGKFRTRENTAPAGELAAPGAAAAAATEHASDLDIAVGGDGGFRDMLATLARRDQDTAEAIADMDERQAMSLSRDFEAYSSLLSRKIRASRRHTPSSERSAS